MDEGFSRDWNSLNIEVPISYEPIKISKIVDEAKQRFFGYKVGESGTSIVLFLPETEIFKLFFIGLAIKY